ncbi:hypothetical protein SELMODRAFT_403665 [Selaginella moellendorffii]|uniref:Uncharacterized protein n=1 Tax=Selaginella moellendorffii TaxID=88036 RepID=D8QS51_SELML|nr:hypothetical protein SELMODRAFT_403665 [Selaginella moellendorffii]
MQAPLQGDSSCNEQEVEVACREEVEGEQPHRDWEIIHRGKSGELASLEVVEGEQPECDVVLNNAPLFFHQPAVDCSEVEVTCHCCWMSPRHLKSTGRSNKQMLKSRHSELLVCDEEYALLEEDEVLTSFSAKLKKGESFEASICFKRDWRVFGVLLDVRRPDLVPRASRIYIIQLSKSELTSSWTPDIRRELFGFSRGSIHSTVVTLSAWAISIIKNNHAMYQLQGIYTSKRQLVPLDVHYRADEITTWLLCCSQNTWPMRKNMGWLSEWKLLAWKTSSRTLCPNEENDEQRLLASKKLKRWKTVDCSEVGSSFSTVAGAIFERRHPFYGSEASQMHRHLKPIVPEP